MQPRVLVDATAVPADRGGVGRYVDGLIAALDVAGGNLAVVCQRSDAERFGRMAPDAWIVPGPPAISHRPARLAWEQTGLPLVAAQVGANVVHSPHYTMPLRAGRPVVVTIHDATFFSSPEVHTVVKGTFFRSATRTSLRRATRTIVPSKATRDELVRLLDADPTRIDVAYHGVDPTSFRPPTDAEKTRVSNRLGLHGYPYVAFLGMLEPRKNVPSLIRGWMQAVADRPEPPALVLAGSTGWDDAVDAAVAEVPSHLRVLRPGYLRFTDLPGFLGGALAGAAVLTTHRLTLPEVGGDAVAYTEPDAASIAANLAALLDDPERRRSLGEAALARAREFTWSSSAEAHLATYARAAARP